MRDFNAYEKELMMKGLCPACGEKHSKYIPGPQGGLMENITTECGVNINVPSPEDGWPPSIPVGQMLNDRLPIERPKSWFRRLFT